jgi:hypothetical protein
METGIIAYLKAFGLNWGTKLSGIASVPFAVAALFVQTARLRILYGITAHGVRRDYGLESLQSGGSASVAIELTSFR